uniref:Uncharacterized protein n=1 Tax=Magallana gigas TaxID=29159 RepID=K1QVE1_MAGGI
MKCANKHNTKMIGFSMFVMVVFEGFRWLRKDDEADMDREISEQIDVMLESIQRSLAGSVQHGTYMAYRTADRSNRQRFACLCQTEPGLRSDRF